MSKKNARDPNLMVKVLEGKKPKKLSKKTILFNAPKHDGGGQDVRFGERIINIEGGETGHIDEKGDLQIGGNLKNIFTGRLYKNDFKRLGEQEGKIEKNLDKIQTELMEIAPKSSFDLVALNTKMLNRSILETELDDIDQEKEFYSITQEATKNLKNMFEAEKYEQGGGVRREETTYPGVSVIGQKYTDAERVRDYIYSQPYYSSQSEEDKQTLLAAVLNPLVVYPEEEKYNFKYSEDSPIENVVGNMNEYIADFSERNKVSYSQALPILIESGSKEGRGLTLSEKLNRASTDLGIPEGGNEVQEIEQTTSTAPQAGTIQEGDAYDSEEGYFSYDGRRVRMNNIYREVERAAKEKGLNPLTMLRLTAAESAGTIPTKSSSKGALGFAQFLASTAKEYGITEEQLTSNKSEDIKAVADAQAQHFKDLVNQFGGDEMKATMAYNGGGGMFKRIALGYTKDGKKHPPHEDFKPFAKRFGYEPKDYDKLTGRQWQQYLEERRVEKGESAPHAYHVENLNYTYRIFGNPHEKGAGPAPERIYPKVDGEYVYDPEAMGGTEQKRDVPDIEPIPTVGPDRELLGSEQVIGSFDQPEAELIDIPPTGGLAEGYAREQKLQRRKERWDTIQSLFDRGDREADPRVRVRDILPELSSLFDQPSYVQGDRYEPTPMEGYNVSFQDRINQNLSSFSRVAQNVGSNPEALSVLAGQLYAANNQVLAEEFRTNQGIMNEVLNQNVNMANQAQMQNIGLRDQQYVRQEQAKENTRQNRRAALNSITSKYGQNEALRTRYNTMKNLTDYVVGEDGRLIHKPRENSKVVNTHELIEEEEEKERVPLVGTIRDLFKRR